MKKLFAFTLAEVLITVAIIGVVAAIVMPMFLQNYQRHVLANQLRKSYSLMSQAFQRMMYDEGATTFNETTYGKNRNNFSSHAEYLSKYVKILRNEYPNNEPAGYTTLNGNQLNLVLFSRIYLADGSIVADNAQNLYIDVNGEAGPNVLDRDLFKFDITADGKIVPYTVSDGTILGYETDANGNEVPIFGAASDCRADGCGAARIIKAGWKMTY